MRQLLLRLSGVGVGIALWELLPRSGLIDATFLPPLSAVLATVSQLAADGSLGTHILVSSFRAVAGFLLAAAIGIPIGVHLAVSHPHWRAALDPLLRLMSQINPFSLMPVFLLFFGSGELVKVIAVGWVALWPVLFYSVAGISSVEPLLIKAARSMSLDDERLLWKVLLPAALPTIFIGIRTAAGLVFFVLVGAEMLGTNGGLGWLVHNSAMNYQITGIYAGALIVVLLGFALDRSLGVLEGQLFSPSPARNNRPAPAGQPWLFPRLGRKVVLAGTAAALLTLLISGGREAARIQEPGQTVGRQN